VFEDREKNRQGGKKKRGGTGRVHFSQTKKSTSQVTVFFFEPLGVNGGTSGENKFRGPKGGGTGVSFVKKDLGKDHTTSCKLKSEQGGGGDVEGSPGKRKTIFCLLKERRQKDRVPKTRFNREGQHLSTPRHGKKPKRGEGSPSKSGRQGFVLGGGGEGGPTER